jgi:hypothetical protein
MLLESVSAAGKRRKRSQKQNQEATKGKAQLGAVNFQGLWNGWHHKLAAGSLDAAQLKDSIVNVHDALNSGWTAPSGHAFLHNRA